MRFRADWVESASSYPSFADSHHFSSVEISSCSAYFLQRQFHIFMRPGSYSWAPGLQE